MTGLDAALADELAPLVRMCAELDARITALETARDVAEIIEQIKRTAASEPPTDAISVREIAALDLAALYSIPVPSPSPIIAALLKPRPARDGKKPQVCSKCQAQGHNARSCGRAAKGPGGVVMRRQVDEVTSVSSHGDAASVRLVMPGVATEVTAEELAKRELAAQARPPVKLVGAPSAPMRPAPLAPTEFRGNRADRLIVDDVAAFAPGPRLTPRSGAAPTLGMRPRVELVPPPPPPRERASTFNRPPTAAEIAAVEAHKLPGVLPIPLCSMEIRGGELQHPSMGGYGKRKARR